jgi:transaldolase
MTKIFCDIADLKIIKKFSQIKIVKGFTTNPSLIRKAGGIDYKLYCKKILSITSKPVSIEVFADNPKEMILQGLEINRWGKNIFVKIPITNSKGKFMGEVIQKLNSKKIKLNITAVYSSKQTKKILKKIDKKTKVIISIFSGRMGDAGKDPLPEIKKSIVLAKAYRNVEILWASTREAYNFTQAKRLKCHIITAPPLIIEKILKFGKSYQKLTVETVKSFLSDSKKSRFKI